MPKRNQAQRRQASAQKQRDQAKKKQAQQKEQAQQQQDDQPELAERQGHPQKFPELELSEKISELQPALEDLRNSDLITDEEAKEMQKMYAFKDEPVEHELLASVFERIEAYLENLRNSVDR